MGKELGSAQEWQDFLDAQFPAGAQFNAVLPDGTLDASTYNLPYLVVMEMEEGFPLLLGVAYGSLHAIPLAVRAWEELDRDGHYIAHVTDAGNVKIELSSWLNPEMADRMLAARPDHQTTLREASMLWQRGEITAAQPASEAV